MLRRSRGRWSCDIDREDFGRIDKSRRVRTEFSEEVADAIYDDERDHELGDIGQESDRGERDRHHDETDHLDRLAPDAVDGDGRKQVAGRSCNGGDRKLQQRVVQQALLRADCGDNHRARYRISVIGEVHEGPGEARPEDRKKETLVVGDPETAPKGRFLADGFSDWRGIERIALNICAGASQNPCGGQSRRYRGVSAICRRIWKTAKAGTRQGKQDPPDEVIDSGVIRSRRREGAEDQARGLHGEDEGHHQAAVRLARVFAHDGGADRIVPADADARMTRKRISHQMLGDKRGSDRAESENEHLVAVDSLAAEHVGDRRREIAPNAEASSDVDSTSPSSSSSKYATSLFKSAITTPMMNRS